MDGFVMLSLTAGHDGGNAHNGANPGSSAMNVLHIPMFWLFGFQRAAIVVDDSIWWAFPDGVQKNHAMSWNLRGKFPLEYP